MYYRRLYCSVALCSIVIMHLLYVAGCSREDRAVRRGGTLIVGEINDFESLNPIGTTDAHARDVYNLLFLSLMDEQADFWSFKPRLAESYDFSDDRRKLTFHLRRDVMWTDGVQCNAYDVAATFKAQKDPDVLWSGRHLKDHIDSVEATDPWTVVYHFNQTYLYQLMDAVDGPILPRHVLESAQPDRIRLIPVEELPTNGPFRVGEWVRGQSLTLVPNEMYYEEGKPYIEKVIFKTIPDQVTLLTQLRGGEIDCMESVPPAEVDNLKRNHSELHIFDYPTRMYGYIGWNCAQPLFDNPRVRRALTMAIDRQLIIDNIFYGYAQECTSPFVPLIWAYNPNIRPIPFDPDRAKEILAAEGWEDTDGDGWLDKDGQRFEFECITNHGNQIRSDILEMVQAMLMKIGVKVNPSILEWTVTLDKIKSSEFESVVFAWRAGTKADLAPIWACKSRGRAGYNRVNYCNPQVDSLNARACSIFDFDKAKPLFYRVQEIIYEEQPYTFVYVPQALNALARRFKGAEPNALSMFHNLHEWHVDVDE